MIIIDSFNVNIVWKVVRNHSLEVEIMIEYDNNSNRNILGTSFVQTLF